MTRLQDLRQSLAGRFPAAFSVPEVARRIGVSERTYRRWEAGEDWPRRRHLQALEHQLGFKVVEESPEGLEAAAGLAWLQPLMADFATYNTSDPTFQEVAILVREANVGNWRPASAVEASLKRADEANPLDTEHGRLIQEAARLLRTTVALVAGRASRTWVRTVELGLTLQPNSLPDFQDQLRAISVPGHPDVEVHNLDQRAPDRMTLQFDFQAASADEADEIARLYVDRLVAQLDCYGPRVLTVSAG